MATVTAPLFSLSASGSVGKLTFSAGAPAPGSTKAALLHSHIVRQKPPKASTMPTSAQLAHRARIAQAAASWSTLSQTTKAKWTAKGVTTRRSGQGNTALNVKNGYPLFLREWLTQDIYPPQLPLLPA